MGDELDSYRQGLVDTKNKLNESYDKLIVTLSGGSLALSITFLKDVIGSDKIHYPILLLVAWGLFILSLTSILSEVLFGIRAHKKAIQQVDDKTIRKEKVGGRSSLLSGVAHWIAAISLVLGLSFISSFVFFNIGESHGDEKTATKATAKTTEKASSKPGASSFKRGRPSRGKLGADSATTKAP